MAALMIQIEEDTSKHLFLLHTLEVTHAFSYLYNLVGPDLQYVPQTLIYIYY